MSSKRLSILWLSHLIPYPPKGGVLQRSYNLIRESARAHDVDLLAFNQPALQRIHFSSPEEAMRESRDALQAFCRRVEFEPIPTETRLRGRERTAARSLVSRAPYTINWLRSGSMRRALTRRLEHSRYDVVHFDTISLAPYRELLRREQPTVMDHHNIESHMMLRRVEHEANPLKRAYYWQEGLRLKAYEKRVATRFDCHVTCSDVDTARLLDLAPRVRAETVPNGVDLEYFTPLPIPRDPNRLIFAGRLSAYANAAAVTYLAEQVWPELGPDSTLSLEVIGSSPPASLEALAERDSRVCVPGFVDDIRPPLSSAGIYVCPITDGGGTKLKVLDALAMGVPLVAHPTACEGIEVREGEHVVFARTPQEYVTAIHRLREDAALRDRLSRAGRALVEARYSYAAIGRQLADIYSSLA